MSLDVVSLRATRGCLGYDIQSHLFLSLALCVSLGGEYIVLSPVEHPRITELTAGGLCDGNRLVPRGWCSRVFCLCVGPPADMLSRQTARAVRRGEASGASGFAEKQEAGGSQVPDFHSGESAPFARGLLEGNRDS